MPVDIRLIKRVEAKATPAPWRREDRYITALTEKFIAEIPSGGIHHNKIDSQNRDLIIFMRNAMPSLLSELEAYREMAEEVRGMNMAFSPDPQIQDNDALWKEKRDAILSKLDERLKGV